MVRDMAAKKKSDGTRGMDSKGNLVGFKPVKAQPTEAFTAPGQKAKGLAKSNVKDRFASTAKTKVVKPTDQLGGGSPLGTSFGINPLNKGQIAGAASTIAGTKGSGQVAKKLAEKVGGFVSGHTFDAASRGLGAASGMGGRIKSVTTPFGKTVAGTKIGSAAEQSARIGNLVKNAEKTAGLAGRSAAKQVLKGVSQVGGAGRVVAGSAAVSSASKKVNRSRKK